MNVPHLRHLGPLAALLVACGGPGAQAPSAETAAPALRPEMNERPPSALRTSTFTGLTVSGGVSLGAYEAGFLYYLSEVAKLPENKKAVDLKLVTGASAGNINALLTILSLCSKPQPNPQRSLFWDIWIGIGARQLFEAPAEGGPGGGALSRKAFVRAASMLEDAWMKGIDASCDKLLAVSTTRIKGTDVTLQDGFKVPKQEEKFVVRIRGQGPGVAPLASNYVDPNDALPKPLLPFPTDQTTPDARMKTFSMVRDLLLASAAFPIAFPPQALPHCMTPGRRQIASPPPPAGTAAQPQRKDIGVATECGDWPVLSEDFIDGGVFDNSPLRLAHHLTSYLDADGNWRDLRLPPPLTPPPPRASAFLFVDPDTAAYPASSEAADSKNLAVLPLAGAFLTNFIATARSKELYTLIEEKPDIDVVLARRQFPTASGHLANFFGFFEESFRRFDFYLGMYDAHRMTLQRLPRPLDATRPPDNAAVWDPFLCMASVFGDADADQSACSPDPARCSALPAEDCARKTHHAAAFRVLLQVAVDRLYDHCEKLPTELLPTIDHHHCLMGALRKPRRVVQNLPATPASTYRRGPRESHFDHTLRLLDAYGFRFEDLLGKHSTGRSPEAMTRVRYQLSTIVERLADSQPTGDAIALKLLGKPALNFFYYAPPPTILYASIGRGTELGASWLLGQQRLRLNFALQSKGLDEILFNDRGEAAFTPLLGLETELYGGPVSQLRAGIRGGFQMSTIGLSQSNCKNEQAFSVSRSDCSRAVAQFPVSIAFIERVRLQIVPEYLIPYPVLDGKSWNLLFGVGGQFISPFF